jgi:protein PhnA
MDSPECPICSLTDVVTTTDGFECVTCGHEWVGDGDGLGEIYDANGTLLMNGDSVVLVKGLPLKGSTNALKIGTKFSNIRLVSGDHEIDTKINGQGILLKAKFVKKA